MSFEPGTGTSDAAHTAFSSSLDEVIEVNPTHVTFRERGAAAWTWRRSKRVRAGVYVRASGTADTPEAAHQQAEGCEWKEITLDYNGRTWRWYGGEELSWSGGRTRHVCADLDELTEVYGPAQKGDAYPWEREHEPARVLMQACGSTYPWLSGVENSLTAAMIAAIEAPDRVRRACAALVATVSSAAAAKQETLQ